MYNGPVVKAGSKVRLALASDEWLVACVRRGDTAAFEALYDRHVRELLAFSVYMLGSRQDAEDAVQATFASAYRALRADGRAVTLRPWLFTITRNNCLSILRRRRPVVELNGEVAPGPDPVAEIEVREEVRKVFDGLRELPENQRAALILAEVHGLSQQEIGEVLGVRSSQVKAYVYQARSKLISDRRARDADCHEIREELASARGAALLRGRLRRHVRSCPECKLYADGVARQRRQFGALLPIVPPLALKYRALEEALNFGAAESATVAGGAAVGASVAGTAADLAGGGLKVLVCKVAAGMVCLGAGAGVGVSALEAPSESAGGHDLHPDGGRARRLGGRPRRSRGVEPDTSGVRWPWGNQRRLALAPARNDRQRPAGGRKRVRRRLRRRPEERRRPAVRQARRLLGRRREGGRPRRSFRRRRWRRRAPRQVRTAAAETRNQAALGRSAPPAPRRTETEALRRAAHRAGTRRKTGTAQAQARRRRPRRPLARTENTRRTRRTQRTAPAQDQRTPGTRRTRTRRKRNGAACAVSCASVTSSARD